MNKLDTITKEIEALMNKVNSIRPNPEDFTGTDSKRKVIEISKLLGIDDDTTSSKYYHQYNLLQIVANVEYDKVMTSKEAEIEELNNQIKTKQTEYEQIRLDSIKSIVEGLSLDYIKENVAKTYRNKVKEIKELLIEKVDKLTLNDIDVIDEIKFAPYTEGKELGIEMVHGYYHRKYHIAVGLPIPAHRFVRDMGGNTAMSPMRMFGMGSFMF